MIFKIQKKTIYIVLALLIIGCTTDTNKDNVSSSIEKVEDKNIEINGVNHYFKIIGTGEPILVLHGGPGLFSDYLISSFEGLAEEYQFIFYDQRGSGKTDFPKDTSNIAIPNFVEDIEAIRKHFKIDKITLAGHSWGGLLALFYAKKYPDNLNKLILIAPGPSNSEYYEKTLTNMQQKRKEEDTKELVRLMMSKDFEKREPKTFKNAIILGDKVNFFNQENAKKMYDLVEFNEENSSKMLHTNSLLERNFFNYDITEGLEVVTCPTIIIIGDMDNVPFASNQTLQENLKNARIEVIKQTAHYPFFEDNKSFTHIVNDFLNPEYQD
ncbi:MAG: hypothetical protein COW67_08535 [Flavobacteriales bacterium CG18_big_fil_WC_8_21_14_2_50_32_9]|nr:MAG: hypothetical protein COW67_08535 [Flavobacteriales bacterium CG18_big_fil_WC_8_21_14_2_50_32_9]PJC63194.1 MAG: hypothetical protein CO022_00505 [Flavobacteriales bacterium CG_4_9_14_0_2_um_filter_32_27]